MSKLRFIFWTILAIGIIFDLFHLTGFAYLLILGTLLSLVYSFIFLIKNFKSNLPDSIMNLAFSSWTIFLLFKFLYLPGGIYFFGYPIIFVIPFIITIGYIFIHVLNSIKFKVSHLILILYFSFSLIISEFHSDKIFYFFRLNSTLNIKSRNLDYKSWDKYSWFLYIANKQNEAIQANLKAQEAISKCLKVPHYYEVNQDSLIIKKHENNILNKDWLDYP